MLSFVIINIGFLFICCLIGFLALRFFKQVSTSNVYFNILISLLIGLIFIVTTFSFFVVRYHSINILFILLFLFFILFRTKRNQIKESIPTKDYLKPFTCLIACLTLFTLTFFFLLGKNNSIISTVSLTPDHYYYAYTAEKITTNKVEGVDFSFNNTSLILNHPEVFRSTYHYFDLWIIAIQQKLTSGRIALLDLYYLLFSPFVLTLSWTAFMAVYHCFKKEINFLDCCIVFIGVCYVVPADYRILLGMNTLNAPKLCFPIILSAACFCLFHFRKYKEGYWLLAALSIMNILALPVICIATFITASYLYLLKQKRESLILFTTLFCFGLAFCLYYFLWGKSGGKLYINKMALGQYVYQMLIYSMKIILRLLLSIVPLLIIRFLVIKKMKYDPIDSQTKSIIFIIVASSYLITIPLWHITDAGQMRSFPGNPLIGVLIFAYVAIFLDSYHKTSKYQINIASWAFFAICIALFSFIIVDNRERASNNMVGNAFIEEVKRNTKDSTKIGYIYNANRCYTSMWANNPNLIMNNLDFMGLVPRTLNKVCLSVILNNDSVPKEFRSLLPLIENGDLKKYANKNNLINHPLNEVQFKFVVDNQIHYLIANHEQDIPIVFNSIVQKKIIDSISGKSFFVLKY